MNAAKSTTNSTKNHQIAPKYLRVQYGGQMPKKYFPFWVKPRFITQKTGWDKYDLRAAREQGTINYREDDGGELWYDLHSLSEKFFIK
jgi:hypothetical protein